MTGTTIPFKIKDVYEGLAEVDGLLTVEQSCLRIEFQTKDSIVGVLKSDLKEIRIFFEDLQEIQYRKKFFGDILRIRTGSMASLRDVPKNEAGEITLHINKRNRKQARMVVSNINLAVAQKDLKNLERP